MVTLRQNNIQTALLYVYSQQWQKVLYDNVCYFQFSQKMNSEC